MSGVPAHARIIPVTLAVAAWRVRQSLTAHQAEVLLYVMHHGAITGAELARLIGITTASMTRLLAGLEADGWIHRDPDPTDARRAIVRPAKRTVLAIGDLTLI